MSEPLVIDDAPSAVAAAHCLSARDRDGRTRLHPSRCSWCDYPTDELHGMVERFRTWAGFDEKRGTYRRHDVRVFGELSRERQAALVREAQGFELEAAAATPRDETGAMPWD